MYIVVAKQKYRQKGSKIVKHLSAGALTRAAALSLLSAKASAVVGDKLGRPTISTQEIITAGRTPAHNSGPFEDARIFIRRMVDATPIDFAHIDLKNLLMDYADPNVPGKVLWTHADIMALGPVHYDSSGNGGWEVYDGVFMEAPDRNKLV